MNAGNAVKPFTSYVRNRSLPFLKENTKISGQFILTLFFIFLGVWFLRHQRTELHEVRHVLEMAQWQLILAAFGITLLYFILQGLMYVSSFLCVHRKIGLKTAVMLFLKRNLVSLFLPAGGISSLALFTSDIESRQISKTNIHFASSIYGFVGILSVVIVAIPVFIYTMGVNSIRSVEWYALAGMILLLAVFLYIYWNLTHKKFLFRLLLKWIPAAEVYIEDIRANQIDRKSFLLTVFFSIFIEFAGIAHLYISMAALNLPVSLHAAAVGYVISVIFLIVSPFLRGLGAVELSMSYILVRFGYTSVDAVAVTFFYRFFEFWLPLLFGGFSFLWRINKLLMRVFPAFLLVLLGIVNIISVLTPAISGRLESLKDVVPVSAIAASNYFVFFAGLFLLVTAAFMLKGLRMAWWFAFWLSLISLVGHLTKAVDYEEALAALFVLIILFITRKDYYIKGNPRLRSVGIQTSLLSMLAVLTYGTIGFYFLDKRHFHIDFSLVDSIRYTIQNFFLLGGSNLPSYSRFAREFILSINITGLLSISFLVYTLVRPYVIRHFASPETLEKAKVLVRDYGKSSLDYFKTLPDKLIFTPDHINAFLSYRVAGNYAVVLEDPVGKNEEQVIFCLREFQKFCRNNGLKDFYYRVPESSLGLYKRIGKKNLFLGQEAVVDLTAFSLEGGQKKSMRNAIHKVRERGYKAFVHLPPVKDGLLQQLRSVSDEWLKETGRSEIIFSQGMFVWEELKRQTIITVSNGEEKVVAFLNIIPNYAENEATYDLIRKTTDAPKGVMDFILIELFNYTKQQGIRYVNLGFAPLSGLNDPHTFPERSMKFAYEKIRSFAHYKGLREFKEKFQPVWYNKYLIYDQDYDLLQAPAVLAKVIRP